MMTCSPASVGTCPSAPANATVTYACGESSLTIETSNNRRLGPRVDYGPSEPLSLRGKTAQLWRFDAADFEVVWQESPKVWARMSAEDVTHDAAEIAEFANHLVVEQWNSPRAEKYRAAPSGDCPTLTDAR
jgi:hypothetical protein